MMGFIYYRVNKNIWKGFRSMEQDLESFGLRLKNWLWNVAPLPLTVVDEGTPHRAETC